MTASTATLTPGAITAPGAGAIAERQLLARARQGSYRDYQRWLDHVKPAGGCTHPIQLAGQLHTVNTTTGEIVATRSTSDMPDGVIYKPCGNRRAAICPSCAEQHRADTYQLIKAGIGGGKTIPDSVRTHPAVFATFTAPSFGLVHTHRFNRKTGHVNPCRSRATADVCPHGKDLRCFTRHGKGDKIVGTPLCLDCYDYQAHVVWHLFASSELWRRTIQAINRDIRRIAGTKHVKVNYSKVAEYQARGAVHFHAIIRLDGINPDDTDEIATPPAHVTVSDVETAIHNAGRRTVYATPPHPTCSQGWVVGWGKQLDTRPLRIGLRGDEEITAEKVAGYIAKYATKSTEATGHVSQRLTDETITIYADADGSHTERLIATTWHLGNVPRHQEHTQPADAADQQPNTTGRGSRLEDPFWRLRRWAHQLGYGGHFLTKSRKYSTTYRVLREARRTYRRAQVTALEHRDLEPDQDQTVIVGTLHYVARNWKTPADAQLANTAAALAREWRQIIHTEI